MRELAGRLSALDPEASATLRVIGYFDRLVDGRVGAEGMLRGAAVLSGVPVGHRPAGSAQGRVFTADGSAPRPGEAGQWPSIRSGDDAVVWLERTGAPHANDAMILERLAISLSIISHRLDSTAPTRRAVEVLLSAEATDDEREQALDRIALPAHAPIRAVAVPSSARLGSPVPHAIVATRFGVVRAALVARDAAAPAAPAGVGVEAASPEAIRDSWRSALVALRLTDPAHPVVRADDLGVLLSLAEVEDQRPTVHPDVAAVERLLGSGWTEPVLRGIAAGSSVRTLAAEAGLHHSSMDARLQKLTAALGYDPMASTGRTRLDVALMLHRLARARIDGG